ncbi:unnamed protein product [Candidula unifasciata]|uniref:A-kinase anchor protein 2 C-terminal domain-containing protein n=1 Tax=Candidula unifasciata TaxID=100452 RepID=A0A8S3YXE8_9EUPU|nr:unnamed protein product [Candidula unifasciata]
METPSDKTVKSSNPSNYGFVYSADRPVPLPEAGWIEKQGDEQKISLYSENVLKEGDTTESVDRESIADLSTTKRQWESIFTSHNITQGDSTLKKKSAPKWEVRIPYKEKNVASSLDHDSESSQVNGLEEVQRGDSEMFKKQIDSESAIEREIRLANEREHVIRKEKEIREKQVQKQKNQGQTIMTSYEAESESFHPVYNELAEADRGSDLWGRGQRNRKDSEDDDYADQSNEGANLNESIIEREIRLQKGREEEMAKTRKTSTSMQQSQKQEQHGHVQHQQPVQNEVKDVNHNKAKAVSYEEAIAKNAHEGESMIAKELRELKEREEELKRLRSSLDSSHIVDEVDGSVHPTSPNQTAKPATANSQRSSQVETPSGHGLWQRDMSAFVSHKRRESEDSASSHGSVRAPSDIPSRYDVKVRPISDGNSDDEDKKPNYFEKQETPIEREMRLARERENELRRIKGLPELIYKEDNSYSSYGASHESNNSSSIIIPRSVGAKPNESMRKFATSRLQHEVQQQNEREHELRSQGKIISTSEEHIEPKKYMEIAGLDKVDGTEKRNFISKKISVSHSESDTSLGGQTEVLQSGGQTIRKTSTVAAGGNMFSYKEFKQTAESKIERELREMREREEELRKQRTGSQAETTP